MRFEGPLRHTMLMACLAQLVGGSFAVIFAVLGLGHDVPLYMAAGGAITLGLAFVLSGGLLAAKGAGVRSLNGSTGGKTARLSGDVRIEVASGIAAVMLGILAALKIDAATLMPAAALVLGAGMMLCGGVLARVTSVALEQSGTSTPARKRPLSTAFDVAVGAGAVVLGILGLIGLVPVALTLLALLTLGVASTLSGASATSRLLGVSQAS